MSGETPIAGRHLPFEAREGILLSGRGVKENGKLASDGQISQALEVFGTCSDNHPVAFAHGKSQEPVPNGSAD